MSSLGGVDRGLPRLRGAGKAISWTWEGFFFPFHSREPHVGQRVGLATGHWMFSHVRPQTSQVNWMHAIWTFRTAMADGSSATRYGDRIRRYSFVVAVVLHLGCCASLIVSHVRCGRLARVTRQRSSLRRTPLAICFRQRQLFACANRFSPPQFDFGRASKSRSLCALDY
jgi:hypothetical protein